MLPMLRIAVVFAAAVFVVGCSQKPSPETADAGAVTAAAEVDAGPPAPVPFQVRVELGLVDGGVQDIDFEPGGKPVVDPASSLVVHFNQRVTNFRVRLFDEADRALVSDDTQEDSANTINYRIDLKDPLKTGHRYALVLDAQTGAAMLDSFGRPVSDVRHEFSVSGEREKPQPARKKAPAPKKKKKR